MIFKEEGDRTSPTVILLHGGGLSDWSWTPVTDALQDEYHIVTVILDGHGEAAQEEFVSIEAETQKLLAYLDACYNGRVYALAGLSIGAQIVVELLAQRPDAAAYAIIESALVYPIKGTTALTVPTYRLCYGLVKRRWFAALQAKALNVPQNLVETYYRDSSKMTRQSLINMTLSNGTYALKENVSQTQAKVLVVVGEKEIKIMRKSAALLHQKIAGSRLLIAPGMKHGEFSLVHPKQYVTCIRKFFMEDSVDKSR